MTTDNDLGVGAADVAQAGQQFDPSEVRALYDALCEFDNELNLSLARLGRLLYWKQRFFELRQFLAPSSATETAYTPSIPEVEGSA